MEITVFLLLGVIVLVALLTRRVTTRTRNTPANPAAPKTSDADGAPKPQEPTE